LEKSSFLKKLSKDKGRSIDNESFNNILKIKNSINESRTNFSDYYITSSMITKYWLLGFIEGDGSFFFTNTRPIFSITQKDKIILEAISKFLENIALNPIHDNLVIPGKPSCIFSFSNAHQIKITLTDTLFQYIFPFFNELTFLTRKGVDFKIWSLGLFLIVYGYHYLLEGKTLLDNLSNNINTKRYFVEQEEILSLPLWEREVQALLNNKPPFKILSGKSHFIIAKEFARFAAQRRKKEVD
jgi:hypothetical protein